MRRAVNRAGMTLVEVLIALVLVSAAAAVVYQSIFYSYKTMMRSRMRLDAQGVAFDKLWGLFNTKYEDLPTTAISAEEATPAESVFSTNGTVWFAFLPETNAPVARIDYWYVVVQVWAPSNSPLFSVLNTNGTVIAEYPDPLVEYRVIRYRGDRE